MARILSGEPQRDRTLFEASLARLAARPLSADSALDLLLYLSAAAQALSWVGELDRAANLIAELRARTRDAFRPMLQSVPAYGHAALGLLALGTGDPDEAAHTLDQTEREAERS